MMAGQGRGEIQLFAALAGKSSHQPSKVNINRQKDFFFK
jgi:hypothetical protein